MKGLKEKIKEVLPLTMWSKLSRTKRSFRNLNWFIGLKGIQARRRVKSFKDIHKGQDCFIIGNGPSLKNMDLNLLKRYYTFGLNKIYLIFDKVDLNLSYLVAVNPLVIQQSINEFEMLSCPTFLSFYAAHSIIKSLEHIYFLNTHSQYIFQKDITKCIPEGHTVTFVAMQIAYYMGFKQVFLIGIDHSFRAVGNPNEKQVLNEDDLSHFDPRYFKNQEWQLPDLEASELFYHVAKFYYERDGRKIYDATLNGKLKIFSKISYEKALKICKPKIPIR